MYPYIPLVEEHSYIKKLSKITAENQSSFKKSLNKEIDNFDKYCSTTYHRLQTSLFNIIVKFTENNINFRTIGNEVDIIHNAIIRFNSLIGNKFKYFVRLRHMADKKLEKDTTASKFADLIIKKYKFCSIGMGDFVCMMSDIYYTLNEMKKAEEVEGDTWVPPTAFVRSTRKYWVRLEDLTLLKLEICKHLPLLRFGKKQGLNLDFANNMSGQIDYSKFDNSYYNNGEGDASKITSIYFDNNKLRLYHDKIVRKEGATLIRVRWYGEEGRTCFMERKTWHDSWVLNDSIKERFDIKWNQVPRYISGELLAADYVDSLRGDAKYDTRALREILGLAEGIQDRILELQLRPSVRTTYYRTAFQRSDNNNIRISIDTSLELSSEPRDPGPGRWCRDIGKGIPSEEYFVFPMAVLEIKLHSIDETPEWLQNIVNSNYIISAYKFSKFLHGTAKLYGSKTKVLPVWFNRTCVHIPGHPLKNWYRQTTHFVPNKLDFDGVLEWQSLNPTEIPQNKLLNSNIFDGKDSDWSISDSSSDSEEGRKEEKTVKLISFAEDISKSTLRQRRLTPPSLRIKSSNPESNRRVMKMNALIDDKEESHLIPVDPKKEVVVTGSVEKGGPVLTNVFEANKKPKKAGVTSVLQATGYEPKTNFALERTFLFWQRCFFLLLTNLLAFYLVPVPDRIIFGAIFAFALILAFYGGITFLIRRKLIRTRSVDGHYDDKWGATILSCILFIAILILLAWNINLLGFALPNNSTIPSFTRVYVTALPISLFESNIDNGLKNIDQVLKNSLPDFTFVGQVDNYIGEQYLTYWDIPSCFLLKNGFVLKSLTDTQSRDISMEIEYLTTDREIINQMELKFPLTNYSRREYFSSPDYIHYGRSVVLPIIPYVDVFSLLNVGHYFESFFLWDIINQTIWNYPLIQVSGSDLINQVYGDVTINIGSPEREAKFRVNVWNQNSRPIFAELRLYYPVDSGFNLTKTEIYNARRIYAEMTKIGNNQSNSMLNQYFLHGTFCNLL